MDYHQAYTDYQANRSIIRKFVRKGYLYTLSKKILGRTLDFGCGIGEMLPFLPDGSMGLEVNMASVIYCRQRGMNVEFYDCQKDQYQLRGVSEGYFSTFLMAHVLEHLEDAGTIFRTLLTSCRRVGIKRVVAVVPSRKGYDYDNTHKTFVDKTYLKTQGLLSWEGFSITESGHFPFDWDWVGDYLAHNELRIVYDSA